MRLLPSTKISETWIVATDGCSTEDTSTCPGDRGGLFDYSQSDTWKSYKNDPKSFYALIAEANLGYIADNNRARVGYDTIALSTPTGGKVIDNQLLAGIAAKQFFLGNLGLSARDSLFNNTQPSLLTALYNNKQIPSRSYGYTAGAFYSRSSVIVLVLPAKRL